MSRAFRQNNTSQNTYYPKLLGTHCAVATEHYLATKAGADLLGIGGNAVDAAVGATFVESLVNPQTVSYTHLTLPTICRFELNVKKQKKFT